MAEKVDFLKEIQLVCPERVVNPLDNISMNTTTACGDRIDWCLIVINVQYSNVAKTREKGRLVLLRLALRYRLNLQRLNTVEVEVIRATASIRGICKFRWASLGRILLGGNIDHCDPAFLLLLELLIDDDRHYPCLLFHAGCLYNYTGDSAMKHLAESLRSYNQLKQLLRTGRLEQAYRAIEQLPRRRRSYKIVKVNLYALLATAKQQEDRALRSLSLIKEGSNILLGLTLSNIGYLHFRQRKIFEAESCSLKAIPLLEADLTRFTAKRHPSKTIMAQLKLLLAFCYLLMIYACCQNDQYKRAYDYILKTKRICGQVLRQELEHQLKAVKEVYKYKLAFGGLHQERLRHLEHHRLIVKSLQQETKYHHEANQKRGDKIQLKLERLNRELIEQANQMKLEDVKKTDNVPEGPSEEDSQKSEDEHHEAMTTTTPLATLQDTRQYSLEVLPKQSSTIDQNLIGVGSKLEKHKRGRTLGSARPKRRESENTKTAIGIYKQPLVEHNIQVSNNIRSTTRLSTRNSLLTSERKSAKVMHILQILDNPIFSESHHPETIFLSGEAKESASIKYLKKTIQERKDIFQSNIKKKTMKNTSSTNTPRFNSKRSKKTPKKEKSESEQSIGESSSDGMVSAEMVFVQGQVFPAEEAIKLSPREKQEKKGRRADSIGSKHTPTKNIPSDEKLPNFHSFGGDKSSKEVQAPSADKYQTGSNFHRMSELKEPPTFSKKNHSEVPPEIQLYDPLTPTLKKTGSVVMLNQAEDVEMQHTVSLLSHQRTIGKNQSPQLQPGSSLEVNHQVQHQPIHRASTLNFTLQPIEIASKGRDKLGRQQLVNEESEELERESKPSKSPRFCANDDDPQNQQRRMTFGPKKSKTEIPEIAPPLTTIKTRVIKSIIKKNTNQTDGLPVPDSPNLLSKSHNKISIVEHAAEYHSEGEQEEPEKAKGQQRIKFIGEEKVNITPTHSQLGPDHSDPLERESASEPQEEQQSFKTEKEEEHSPLISISPAGEVVEPSFKKEKPMKTEPAEQEQGKVERQKFASAMLGQRGSAKQTHSQHDFDSNGRARPVVEHVKEQSVSRQDNLSERGVSRNKKSRKGSHHEGASVKAASVDLIAASNELIRNVNSCLEGERAEYLVQYTYQKAGTANCNQILQLFLNEIRCVDEQKRKAASAFVWVLKQCIDEQYGPTYGEENDAQEIALLANKFVLDVHPKYKGQAPFSFEVFIDLTEIFFLWLYRRKLTKYMIREVQD